MKKQITNPSVKEMTLYIATMTTYVVVFMALSGCLETRFIPRPGIILEKQPTVTTAPASSVDCPAGGTVVTINGTPIVVCDGANGQNGSNGSNGVNGQDGAQGPTGATGAQGPAGQNSTPFTMVQFCPGTATYPSQFPEYGIVIGTQVFGVYSLNGGFLALLPPGVYSSNGINDSCTFTINADGSITH